mgnify:CR=1 FL=1
MTTLDTQVGELSSVGRSLAPKLKKLGIETARDLIFYYPFRYDDFSQLLTIDKLSPGMVATVRGKVEILKSRRSFRRRKFLVEGIVSDETGSIKVIWFNQPWIVKNLKIGDEVYLAGKVSGDLFDLNFNSPSYEKIYGGKSKSAGTHTGRLVPIYSLTEGVSAKQIRFLIRSILPLTEKVEDFLPSAIKEKEKLFFLSSALEAVHFPKDKKELNQARKRLAFDEIFLSQLWAQIRRQSLEQEKSPQVNFFQKETADLVKSLGFELTSDQKRSAWAILNDLQKERPMNRLVEGDVGSGKTLVAVLALYNTALSGFQSCFMAPTEILALQHFETIRKLLNEEVKIGLLTRSQRVIGNFKVSKKEFLDACQSGELQVVIGTHALIQSEVDFNSLSLVVVDEQHRFGVSQRKALKQKSRLLPHFLSLSATPIPRSLALTLYGDLDLSVIQEMPKGRKKIMTRLVSPEKRQLAYEFILKQIQEGRQVFVVCPLIDLSDKLGVRSVKEEFKKLNEEVFPDIPVGLLHGKMKPQEKEEAINDFVSGKNKILVATSVIEVGIDVKNASVMMIEGAERFGLAQLHQFRGRVGRGEHQSYCFLFTESEEPETLRRLEALVESSDGFALAEKDLSWRGAGQLFGFEQSGFSKFKMADLSDLDMVKKVKQTVLDFLEKNTIDNHPLLQEKLESLGFSDHLE